MHSKLSAFSLLELAIVLVLTGLISAGALTLFNSSGRAECYTQTRAQLATIKEAIERYSYKNDRFPMPALRSLGVEDVDYGREVAPTDLVSMAKLDQVGGVTFGALPFQAIGIPVANATDCWGNKFTYAVTTALTDSTNFLIPSTNGAINIKSDATNVFLPQAGYALISHGDDQFGAVKANYRDLTATPNNQWCAFDAAKPLKTENCEISPMHAADIAAAEFNDGRDGAAKYFDDLVVYRGKPWRMKPDCSCRGPGPVDLFTAARPPENFTVNPRCN